MQKEFPSISIILLAKETPSLLLSRCLNSIWDADEIILVDTNPADSGYSYGLQEDFHAKKNIDDRKNHFFYLSHPDQGDFPCAKNEALSQCHGDVICFLSAVDYWENNRLLSLRKLLANQDTDSDFCFFSKANLQNSRILSMAPEKKEILSYIDIAQLIISHTLLKKTGGFDEKLTAYQDAEFYFRLKQITPITIIDLEHTAVLIDPSARPICPPKTSALAHRQIVTKHGIYFRSHAQERKEIYQRILTDYHHAHVFFWQIYFFCLSRINPKPAVFNTDISDLVLHTQNAGEKQHFAGTAYPYNTMPSAKTNSSDSIQNKHQYKFSLLFSKNKTTNRISSLNILYCHLLCYALHKNSLVPSEISCPQIQEADIPGLWKMALAHHTTILIYQAIYDSYLLHDHLAAFSSKHWMQPQVLREIKSYYQMEAFTDSILCLLEKNEINFFLIKGLTMSRFYPEPCARAFCDVDLYCPDPISFQAARQCLEKNGFHVQHNQVHHHIAFEKTMHEKVYLVELHHILAETPAARTWQNIRISQTVALKNPTTIIERHTLSANEQAISLLLHMHFHFIRAGFGILMLCDWTLFLENTGKEMDSTLFLQQISTCGLEKFAMLVTMAAQRWLYLSTAATPWLFCLPETLTISEEQLSDFFQDILNAGKFGKTDAARMIIPDQKKGIFAYPILYHQQMKARYPHYSKIPLLWPLLWISTGAIYLRNNHHLRHTSTFAILKNSRKRAHLLQMIIPEKETDRKF